MPDLVVGKWLGRTLEPGGHNRLYLETQRMAGPIPTSRAGRAQFDAAIHDSFGKRDVADTSAPGTRLV